MQQDRRDHRDDELGHRPRARGGDGAGSARAEGEVTTYIADLDAFLQEHRRCGDLDSAVEGDRVWMTCTCGAVINRSADDD